MHVMKIFADPGVSGAASSQNLSHQQASHQLGQAIHIPQGVTQYVTMQRPHQVKPVSHPKLLLPFITCSFTVESINLNLISFTHQNQITLLHFNPFKLIITPKNKKKKKKNKMKTTTKMTN